MVKLLAFRHLCDVSQNLARNLVSLLSTCRRHAVLVSLPTCRPTVISVLRHQCCLFFSDTDASHVFVDSCGCHKRRLASFRSVTSLPCATSIVRVFHRPFRSDENRARHPWSLRALCDCLVHQRRSTHAGAAAQCLIGPCRVWMRMASSWLSFHSLQLGFCASGCMQQMVFLTLH